MKLNPLLLTASLTVLSIFFTPSIATAEIIKQGGQMTIATKAETPTRGTSMSAVQKRFGKASKVSTSKGKTSRKNPRITRWNYGSFSVYFENKHVVHTVLHR